MQSANLTLVSITNTNIKSQRGTWKLKVTFRLDNGPPQEIIVAQAYLDSFTALRNQIRKKFLVWVHHETQLTGIGPKAKTWDNFVCDAIMAGYQSESATTTAAPDTDKPSS